MTEVEMIMLNAIDSKQKELDRLRAAAEERKAVVEKACRAFHERIKPLEKFGIRYELRMRQHNVHSATEDYCYPRFGWEIFLFYCGGPIFWLNCKIDSDDIPKAKFKDLICYHGEKVEGQDAEGWFTAEQLAAFFAKKMRM